MKSFYLEQAEKLMQSKYKKTSISRWAEGLSTFSGYTSSFDSKQVEDTTLKDIISSQEKDTDPVHIEEFKRTLGEPLKLPDLSKFEVVSSTSTPAERELEEVKTYHCFSGCDMVAYFNDKVYGELSSIDFFKVEPALSACVIQNSDYIDRYLLEEYPVVVIIAADLFNSSIEIIDDSNILIKFLNEYGAHSERTISGVKKLGNLSSFSIDSLCEQEVFILCAKDVSPLIRIK